MRLEKVDKGLQIFPVRTVMAGQQDDGLEAQAVRRTNMVTDILEVDPRRHGCQPRPGDIADFPMSPGRVGANLVDMPIVGWGDDAAAGLGGLPAQRMRLQRIEAKCIVRSVWLAHAV